MPVSAYLKAGLFVVAAAAALFAAAGTVAIPGFWAYLAIFAVVMIVSFAALDPDLLRERMRPGGKKPPLALRVFSLVLFMHWIVAGLDRGRFHWSDNVPDWLQGVCLFTFAAGYALALWAMRVNRFFSSAIRIQTDRGQHVVTTGPYALLRRAGPMAARSGHLVRARPHLGKHAAHQSGSLPSQRGSKRAMSESGPQHRTVTFALASAVWGRPDVVAGMLNRRE